MKNIKVELRKENFQLLASCGLNYGARTVRPFDFLPTSFTSAIDGLKPKIINRNRQLRWMSDFLDDPMRPITYCLVSAPNDGQAKLLAGWMMQHAIKYSKSLPLWHDLTNSFDNPLLKDSQSAFSLLVLNNVGAQSPQTKLEKLRDDLEAFADKPRIVVATGCDPFMFFTRYLYLPLNACAFLTTSLVKKTIEA